MMRPADKDVLQQKMGLVFNLDFVDGNDALCWNIPCCIPNHSCHNKYTIYLIFMQTRHGNLINSA